MRSNTAEDNLQSSTESGNNNINTQTNKMVVDNVIQSQASRKEHIEDKEVQRQALHQEPEDNKVQRKPSRQEPVEFNEVQRQASRQEPGHISQKAPKRQIQRDNTRCKKRVQTQVKASVEFLKQLSWFEEKNKRVCLQTLHI